MIYSLLFVDDDREICTIAKSFLEKTEVFRVFTADSVKESYSLLKNNHYDAIISDFNMPEEDGISFLKEIRNTGNKIPFVILTGMGKEEVIINALNNGADLYFVKDESPQELFELLTDRLVPLIKSKQAEIVFHEIFYQSPNAILLYNSEGRLIQANPACMRMFGVSDRKEIDLFDQGEDQSIPVDMLNRLQNGEKIEYAVPHDFMRIVLDNGIPTKQKDQRFLNIFITPISLSCPNITGGYLVQIQDVTQQKKSESILKSSEERYRSFFVNSHSVMLIIHPDSGEILDANSAACSYYGYSLEELRKMNIFMIHYSKRKQLLQDTQSSINGEKSVFYLKHRLSSGEVRDVEVHSGPISIENQQVLYLIIHDITDKKRSEEALLMANKKLNLLSSITRHDIINVLTALIGYLEFAGTETSIEETRHFILKAQVAANSIRHHIEFTRDYQDLGTKEPVWHDIRGVLKSTSNLINAKDVSILFDNNSELLVLADPLLIKVIYNIMENSMRHGEKVTKISSYWHKEIDGNLTWIFEDDGIGIPSGQKHQIFAKEVGSNTGLGLFLAREILAITGISIKETGEYGKGAKFTISVPDGKYYLN